MMCLWPVNKSFNLHSSLPFLFMQSKSNNLIDQIVRFAYNIIEKKYFHFKAITIYSSRKEMMICLLPQLN